VFSTEPVDAASELLPRESRMSLAAVGGGAALGLLAMGSVVYTQQAYPLITGGMPIVSFWATGVIFYEFTMLGAIAATFLMFLRESGLLHRDRTEPVPAIAAGHIYLRVECEPEQVTTIGECLYRAGAISVKKAEKVA
jgi:hypothetical protein